MTLQVTGKERDAETGLDYFGARYFSGAQGRFTSPDQPFADQHVYDPQSWNLYSYARNNLLKFVDLAGQELVYADERLRIISDTRRAQSPSYDSWLRGFDGPNNLNLRIGYGATPTDPDGSATIGNFRGNISPAIQNCSSATDCQTIPGRLVSGEITVNNALENDPERASYVLAHEVRHGDDARTNPDRYVNEPIRDQRGRVIPHDQRPVEQRANQGRDQSNRERRDLRRNNPERNRELERQQRERLRAEEERRRREEQH